MRCDDATFSNYWTTEVLAIAQQQVKIERGPMSGSVVFSTNQMSIAGSHIWCNLTGECHENHLMISQAFWDMVPILLASNKNLYLLMTNPFE